MQSGESVLLDDAYRMLELCLQALVQPVSAKVFSLAMYSTSAGGPRMYVTIVSSMMQWCSFHSCVH